MKFEEVFDTIISFLAHLAIAGIFVLIVLACWHIRYAPPQPVKMSMADYRAQLEEQQASTEARAEWLKLRKKHGYPTVVIFEPDRTPYYMCGVDRKTKCKFM